MFRIDNANATSTLPTPLAPGPVTKGYFQSGNPAVGQKATTVDRDWANTQQEEIAHVVEAAGITLSKTDNTQLLQALRSLFVTRTKVTANMTIYVNPTSGSDTTGNGLTPGTAFATIQTAVNVVYTNYDWNGHLCTIQLADGTYTINVTYGYLAYFAGLPFGMPQYGLTVQGNPSLPQNVILNAVGGNCLVFDAAIVTLSGVTVTGTGSVWTPTGFQGYGVLTLRGALAVCSNMRGVNCGAAAFRCDTGSVIVLQGSNNAVSGSGQSLCISGEAGQIYLLGSTLTVTGFNATQAVFTCDQGRITADATTFIGSATGSRYAAVNCGVITTAGGGPNYLPGSSAGNAINGGVYF